MQMRWLHMRNPLNNPTNTYKIHAYLAVTWMLLVIPTWYLWRTSIFWIAFISLYANFVSHWGAWQAVRAELVAGRAEQEAKRVAALVAVENQIMLEQIVEAVARSTQIQETILHAQDDDEP
jgi:hypothetical protein